MIPLNVCLGWWLCLCRSVCVSVGLKKTLVSRVWVDVKLGPLYTVVSK